MIMTHDHYFMTTEMKVVLSQVPSYLRMLYVFTCFQSMDMFEVCFKYPYVSSKYDINKSVIISMFQVCFSYVSRVFKVFFKCFFVWAGAGPRRLQWLTI